MLGRGGSWEKWQAVGVISPTLVVSGIVIIKQFVYFDRTFLNWFLNWLLNCFAREKNVFLLYSTALLLCICPVADLSKLAKDESIATARLFNRLNHLISDLIDCTYLYNIKYSHNWLTKS